MIYNTDLHKFNVDDGNFGRCLHQFDGYMFFSRFFAGLNRGAKSMLQKFKILPMAYFASNKFTETAIQN